MSYCEIQAPSAGHSRQLHVVHVVLSLNVGGLERNVVNQVREGQKLGQKVSIVCLDEPGVLAPRVEAMGARVVTLGRLPGLRPAMILRTRKALAALRPDVVHTHQIATLLYGAAAAKLLGVPVVVHTEHTRELYATRLRTRLLGRIGAKSCDVFYCLTEDMAKQVRDARVAPARKVRIIQNGIDIDHFTDTLGDRAAVRQSLGVPADAPLIGTVGRLNEIKRQDVLIRAFDRLRRQFPDAHLVLVGEGPARAELEKLVADLRLGSFVHFAGYQPSSGPYLRAMDLFSMTSRIEGMPQSMLEASVVGVPVVASRVGGIPELVQDRKTGILFEFGDEVGLAAAWTKLLTDHDYARRLAEAASTRVRQTFSVARMAGDYNRDFLELLGERRRRCAVSDFSGAATTQECVAAMPGRAAQ
jgi:glycosyltransferase involved in cell wall biosynthesis